MTQTRYLFVANNPGGFKALEPVYLALKNESHLSITRGLQSLSSEQNFTLLDYDLSDEQILVFVKKFNPRLLILGTSVSNSVGGDIEKKFIHVAKKNGLPTLSVLDHWCHYIERFSLSDKFDTLPDYLAIMDQKAHDEMFTLGFNPSILKITGQPAFDSLTIDAKKRNTFLDEKNKLFPLSRGEILITFVSEPVIQDYGSQRGYNQYEVLNDLLDVLHANKINARVALKAHPREDQDYFRQFIQKNPVTFLPDLPARNLVLSSDLVVGMTSVLLIESNIMGVPTISYQPGLELHSPFVKMMSPLHVLLSQDSLNDLFSNLDTIKRTVFPYHENRATQNIVDLIKQLTPDA